MNKIFHIGSTFKAYEEGDDLHIAGMASTTDKDRVGDVIEASAWTKGGLANYLNNPVILFNHDYDKPIGRAVSLGTNDKGLQLKAKIAKSAGHIGELIKEGVLGAFSVGFMVRDAEYDKETDGYRIKDAELLEVSVVTVPANQAATFSLAKSFNSVKEYENFKKTLREGGSSNDEPALCNEAQENNMEIDKIVAEAVQKATAAMAMAEAERKAVELAEKKAAEKAAEEARLAKEAQEKTVIEAVKTGTERLVADFEAKLNNKTADQAKVIEEMKNELAEKSQEIQKMRESKRTFVDRGNKKGLESFREELLDMHILGIITNKGLNTNFAKNVIQKVNVDSGLEMPGEASIAAYETFVSTEIERDIELDLVLEPLFRKVQMNAATMIVPTIPDSGYAEFVTAQGSGASTAPKGNLESDTGSPNTGIDMSQVLLTAHKLVSKSYVANETEEDAIIPVLPVIRAAMARSHARAIEQSILMGGHTTGALAGGYDGLIELARDANKTLNGPSPYAAGAVENISSYLIAARKAMGKYGRRPSDLIYVVSLEAYYALLEDVDFQLANELGEVGTRVTGDIGSVYGTRVVVCDEFPSVADGRAFAVAVNTRNFVVPVLRGVTVEQEYSAEKQYRCLVATQRRGFKNLFGNGGGGQVVAVTY